MPEKDKIPTADKERRGSASIQDLLDIRTNQERMDIELKNTNALVVKLLQGFNDKVIPMLDGHEQTLAALPKQLEDAFAKQADFMKGYMENRLKPAIDTTAQGGGQNAVPAPKGSGFDLKGLFDFATKQIDQAGGL